MDIRYLQYFLAIAKYQNITRASEELHIAQPALSVYLSRMEQQLGTPLFDRKNKRLTINACGLAVQDSAVRILREYETMLEAVARCIEQRENCLKVGISDLGFPQSSVADFFQLYPQYRSDIRLCYAGDEVELLNKSYDLIIAPLPPRGGNCKTISLYRKELLVAIPYNHPYYTKETLTMGDLNGQYLCLSGQHSHFGWFVQRELEKSQVHLKKLEGTVVGAQSEMLRQKCALGIVVPGMLSYFNGNATNVRLVPFSPPIYRETGLLLGSQHPTKCTQLFCEYLVQRFQNTPTRE